MNYTVGIIPARYASTRFPGKPLISIQGKSMIQRVYEQCLKSDLLNEVIVATDDKKIQDHVLSFGGKCVMTSEAHQSGSDRCAEVVSMPDSKAGVVINIQGDEPFIHPEQINQVIRQFNSSSTQIATLKKRINTEEDIKNPNMVKVITDASNRAIYFSRAAIPYRRNQESNIQYFKHIGIYGYRKNTLLEISKLPKGSLEMAEMLEQLRWIEAGIPISVMETEFESISIDSPADLELVEKMMKS